MRQFRYRTLSIAFMALPITALLGGILAPLSSQTRPKPKVENPEEVWVRQIEPMLDKYCLKCHAGVRQQGGLDLRSLETILRGGDHGAAILPGKPNESRVMQYVLPNAVPHMPPDPRKQLTAGELTTLRAWISMLPVPKTQQTIGTSKNEAWVTDYLEEYRRLNTPKATPPANLPVSEAIDWFLQKDWQQQNIVPSRICDDATFVRRLYLDLAGRIPSTEEVRAFLVDPPVNRRQRLIEKLLASEDYPRHMREMFDTFLMGRPNDQNARERVSTGWNAYLEDAFRSNRAWNDLVREILVARPTDSKSRGVVWFLAEKRNSYQAIAESVAPVVFGMQIKCAQCHNHPLSWEIEQRHYWGLVAAFNRSKNVDSDAGLGVSESAIGGFIKFANLKKESQPATLVFLNGKSVEERIPSANEKEMDRPDLYLVPPVKEGQKVVAPTVPKFSRRESFANSVTHDNPLLARAFVNRMWLALMGRGFVVPVDQIDSRHRPSHPALFQYLSSDFEKSGYDIKRLVRTIVSSHAYQRDSKPATKTPPRPETFARANEKPLSAEQLLRSLWVATKGKGELNLDPKRERAFVVAFPDLVPDTYSPSMQQALFLTNSPLVNDLLKPEAGSLTTRIMGIGSSEAKVREAFQTLFGRSPDTVELQNCVTFLKSIPSSEKGTRSLLWALLTSAEFQVNH